MTGYVIKVTAVPTANNTEHLGEIKQWFELKGNAVKDTNEPIWDSEAYKSKGMAERVLKKKLEDYNYYKNYTNVYEYWDNEYEVAEIKVW